MRTHVELNNAVLDQVVRLGRFPSKKAALNAALEEYANILKRKELLQLRGQVAGDGDLDRLRTTRTGS